MVRSSISTIAFTLALCVCVPSMAADKVGDYPHQPIRLVVPFEAGGYVATVTQLLGNALSQRLGTPVIVDARPGASTLIGTQIVAKAPADGYTLLMISTTHAVNPNLFKKLPYDPIADFEPVTLVASSPFAMVVPTAMPVNSLADFINLARSRPGALNYASSGAGSSIHLTGELLKNAAGVDITHVPYKGSGPALIDLAGGHVQMTFTSTVTALPYIKRGQMRAIATTGLARNKALPEVPTVAESGYPGFEAASWVGILAPAKTPPEIVQFLQREIAQSLKSPAVINALNGDGAEPGGSTPQEFGNYYKSEIDKWAKVIAQAGIKLD